MSSPTSIPSGLITDDTQVFTGRGTFNGVNVLTGTIAIYDGTDNSGKLIYQGTGETFDTTNAIRVTEGLFVDAATGDGEAIVYYGA